MAGYYGTELQQHLQRRADELAAEITSTPGLCSAGRMVSTDDVDLVGLDYCSRTIAADGGFGFRFIPVDRTDEISRFLTARGQRVDWWDTFTGNAADCHERSERIAARGPPAGLRQVEPTAESLEGVQAFLVEQGIAPFSRSTLAGETVTGRCFTLVDERGDIAATAFTYMPHNASSRFHGFGWVGLVAVAPAHRGRAIGTYVNACAVSAAFAQFGATYVYEQVSATNTPSRRMVESCGLTLHPFMKAGLGVRGTEMFTR